LGAPVFFESLTCKTERCALPPHPCLAASLLILLEKSAKNASLEKFRESVTATLSSPTQLQEHMGLLNLIVS
jgi:hypothetical protein